MADCGARPPRIPSTCCGRSSGRDGRAGWARFRRPASLASRPRSCTRCQYVAGSIGSPTSTGVTGEALRRHDTTTRGSLIHVDVTKFGNVPRAADTGSSPCPRPKKPHATPGTPRNAYRSPSSERVRVQRARPPFQHRPRRDPHRRNRRHRSSCAGRWPVRRPRHKRRTPAVG